MLPDSVTTVVPQAMEVVMETRTCPKCGSTFEVDTRKDPVHNPRKYCSKQCLRESQKELNAQRRSAGKWKVIRNDLDTPNRSMEWVRDEAG